MKKKINISLFLLFVLLTSFLFLHHENWRDEIQAFLLIRDMDIISFVKNISYEGHPFFYYLILYPFIILGFDLKIVNILTLLFMYISVYLILFKTNMKYLYKVLFIFSYPFLFQFSIIGRSYSLIVLLVVLISILYKDKNKNIILISILIGLLLNTHLLCSGFCFIIFVLYFYKEFIKNKNFNKSNIIGFSIISLFGVLFILQFMPRFFINDGMSFNNSFSFIYIISNIFNLFMYGEINIFGFIFILFNICFIIFNFKDNKELFIIYIFSILVNSIIISIILKSCGDYFGMVCFIYLLFVFINGKFNNKFIDFIVFFMIIYYLFNVFYSFKLDYKYNYSSSLETSNYISNNISSDKVFYCFYDASVSPLSGYLEDYKFRSVIYGDFSYIVWNKDRESNKFNLDNINVGDYYIYINYERDYCTYDDLIINELNKRFDLIEVFTSEYSINIDESYKIFELYQK